MNSIRSELSSLIVGVYRSRDSTLAGLFSIFTVISSVFFGAVLAEFLSALFPQAEVMFRACAVFWAGTRMRALGNMMHECSHGIFVRRPQSNTQLGHLLAVLDLSSFTDYCRQHTTHHAYLGDAERDLDFRSRHVLIHQPQSMLAVLKIILLSLSILPLWILILRPVIWAKDAPLWSNALRIVFLLVLAVALILPATQLYALMYVVAPYLTTYQWMRMFSDASDHLFLMSKEHSVERSRNHVFNAKWLNAVLFPRNDGYHLLHHLFPSLPVQMYPDVHEKLLAHSWYRERSHGFGIAPIDKRPLVLPVDSSHGQSR